MDDFPSPETPLTALSGWWLVTQCRCRTVSHPCRLLAADHGARPAIDVARRLRCSRCGEKPAAHLDEDPRGGTTPGQGAYPPSRKVALTPGDRGRTPA